MFQQVGGQPVAEIDVEGRFKAACNSDEVCVELVYEPSGADLTTCIFTGTRPKMGTRVDRGAKVVITCRPEETTDTTDTTETTGGTESTESTDTTGGTQSTEGTQATDTTTTPPGGTPSPPSSS